MRLILVLQLLVLATAAMAIDMRQARKDFFEGCMGAAATGVPDLDNPTKRQAYCTCMIDTLTAVLTPAEWDQVAATGATPPSVDFNGMIRRCIAQAGIRSR